MIRHSLNRQFNPRLSSRLLLIVAGQTSNAALDGGHVAAFLPSGAPAATFAAEKGDHGHAGTVGAAMVADIDGVGENAPGRARFDITEEIELLGHSGIPSQVRKEAERSIMRRWENNRSASKKKHHSKSRDGVHDDEMLIRKEPRARN
ncbi:hypothetical protein A0U90_14145 (plasmid) [Kozakia baliensis]|uniref:hypothetical protein n=1 Tax=Kozakia baliensis TaxID=153496 RepID=UPI000495BC75|nr:hypothetical protein [Kozakia baliensis]AOX21639.1 hypothetical protein A0U90_14145 [Kozakia baliensis]